MRKYWQIYLVFAILSSNTILAYTGNPYKLTDTLEIEENRLKELLLENSLEDCEDSKLLDYLNDLERNPLDLNTMTKEELESVPFINSHLAKEIIEYRDENYPLRTKRDLLNVDNVNEKLYKMVKIFFTVKKQSRVNPYETEKEFDEKTNESKTLIKNLDILFRSRFQQDLQIKEGFINGEYPGSRAKIFNQLRLNYVKNDYLLKGNLILEKDPGEKSITDFSSGFIELKNYKNIKKLIVGDYSMTFGQGLGLWSGLGFQKGSVAVDPVKKRGDGISGYSSVDESQFFRGGAINVGYGNFDFLFYLSNNYFDASIDSTLDEVSSFYFDGYHRTLSEQNRENAVAELLYGSHINYNIKNLRLGMTYWSSKFSKSMGERKTSQLFSFTGEKANMLSLDYDFLYKNINIYGEFARSQTGAISGIGAMHFAISRFINLVFLYRNYPRDFAPVHSFGFGENNGDTKNESGFYTGILIKPFSSLQINSYFDQFKFPYRTYSDPGATLGNDFLTYVNWDVNYNLSLNVRYKNENKEESRTTLDEYGRTAIRIDTRNQMNIRLGFDYLITDMVRVRSRYEYVLIDYKYFGGDNKGELFFSDLKIVPFGNLSLSLRLIFFDTENYDSRIYEYEDDIQGVMSNIGLYGKGRRWYTMIKYNVRNMINIYGKYSETYYSNVNSIGSGNDLIKGDINNKLNIGVEVSF